MPVSSTLQALLVRLYRLLQPLLGPDARLFVHRLRQRLTGDTSELGEALAAAALVPDGAPQWVVEVGANDGVRCSNSRYFVRRGWRALLVEPNPVLFARLLANTGAAPGVTCVEAACSDAPGTMTLRTFEGDDAGLLATLHPGATEARGSGTSVVTSETEVRVERLTDLLAAHGVPARFGVLSVDTEGHDFAVLAGLDLDRFRPAVLITETDEASEPEKHAHLQRHGYRLADTVGVNTLWLDTRA